MSRDERTPPLPSDAGAREDVMPAEPPDGDAAPDREEASPLPPDPGGREDIMSDEPRR
jgi:hypothetical protein